MEKARAGVYVRISADKGGEGLGVARQEADARELCERRGWAVADVYCDNDISAWSGKTRPEYRRMVDDVAAGRLDAIVAWHPDRLHRQTRELGAFIDLVDTRHLAVETVTAGALDLSTPSGRMQARIVGTVAEYESEHKSERIRRKLDANAADGRHHGGSRPYGWLNDRVTLDPQEAAAVREAANMVLLGHSMKAIARHLNEAGHVTASGREWRDVNVRDMLVRDRNAGLRVHHGEVVGAGRWQPILDEATLLQVKAVLLDPSRRTTPGRAGQVHLLSALATCGVCGGPVVVAHSKPYKGKSVGIYRCRTGHVSRVQSAVDAYVRGVVIQRLSEPNARDLMAKVAEKGSHHGDRVGELRQRLDDAAGSYALGVLTLAQLETITRQIRPEIEKAEAAASNPAKARVLGPLFDDPPTAWDGLTTDQRRAVIDFLMEVAILPTGTRAKEFDEASVRIEWKAPEGLGAAV